MLRRSSCRGVPLIPSQVRLSGKASAANGNPRPGDEKGETVPSIGNKR